CKVFGGDRRISLCRELTKLHEEVLRMTFDEAVAYYVEKDPRGEYVLIIEGAPKQEDELPTMEDGLERVRLLMEDGASRKDAVKQAAKELRIPKNQLYEASLQS
ncbi:MAG: 16S rRNA (cytidine(1402)-2'-O)-methyltransferase, partial [Eubacteriales bacterium]